RLAVHATRQEGPVPDSAGDPQSSPTHVGRSHTSPVPVRLLPPDATNATRAAASAYHRPCRGYDKLPVVQASAASHNTDRGRTRSYKGSLPGRSQLDRRLKGEEKNVPVRTAVEAARRRVGPREPDGPVRERRQGT